MAIEWLSKLLGFDPFKLAGIPNGLELQYCLITLASIRIGVTILRPLTLKRYGLFFLFACVVIGAIGCSAVSEILFKDCANEPDLISGRPDTIAVRPFPGLRDPSYNFYAEGGRYAHSTTCQGLQVISFQPGNVIGTYITILLHISFYVTALTATIVLILYTRNVWRNWPSAIEKTAREQEQPKIEKSQK